MDLTYVKKLVRIVEQSGVDEIEVEQEGLRVRVAKHSNNSHAGQGGPAPAAIPAHAAGAPAAQTPSHAAAPAAAPEPPAAHYHEIKSPIVGTFYRAPAPDADPYVEIGAAVQPKTVLCIIEAMKLMNEIESDVAGKIVKVMVENGKPVEYNQTLFLIEPA